jgi:hypothetical protein
MEGGAMNKPRSADSNRKTPRRSVTADVLDLVVEPRSVGKAKSGFHSMQGGGGITGCCESGGNPK